jgi:hypothetical protein
MPYVGNSPTANFASVTKDAFSGDGSTTAFTLSKAATTNGVAVFVENVRQEPTTAYAVSGTTLTFTAAPVSASGNNIYVLHHNAPASTATHPAAQALTATSGTFTGTVTAGSTLDMNGTELILDADADTSITADTDDQIDVKIAGSDAMHFLADGFKIRNADALIFGENNSTSRYQTIGGEVAANNLTYRTYQSHIFKNTTGQTSTTDGTEVLKIDANGHVTMPKQSAFSAYLSAAQNNIAANNSFVDVQFNTEVFDLNADYNTSNYTFTAPVTGKYQFNAAISLSNLDSSSDYAFVTLTTSNRAYYNYIGANQMDADDRMLLPISILADLDASDTAKIRLGIYTGTAQADISTGEVVSSFQGYLVC